MQLEEQKKLPDRQQDITVLEHTLNIGSTLRWNTLLERPRPDLGFRMTSILGGFLHRTYDSGGNSLVTKSEACFFDEARG